MEAAMAGRLPMGQKELTRGKLLEMVKRGQLTLKSASFTMRVSYRQAKRLYRAYKKEGDKSLIHGNHGRCSNNKTPEETVKRVIELYRCKYNDFGPTFAAEKLLELDRINISVSVLRRILIDSKDWRGQRRSLEYRSRRERKERFGELVQFDGSHHKWFEGRGPSCCLMSMIDDAGNVRLSRFFEQETLEAGYTVLWLWISKYGIPEALYCDKKNAFVITREPTDTELLKGITEPKSHFGRACDKLGIEVIAAHSPQAKGRIERNHGIDQDRLVKELRLADISTIEAANEFLEKYYLPKMNQKFSKPPFKPDNAHVPLGPVNLHDILCLEEERAVAKNYTVRFNNRIFQILETNKKLPRPSRDNVIARTHLNGEISILWNNKKLLVKEIHILQSRKICKAA
jgi:hypothetical protein